MPRKKKYNLPGNKGKSPLENIGSPSPPPDPLKDHEIISLIKNLEKRHKNLNTPHFRRLARKLITRHHKRKYVSQCRETYSDESSAGILNYLTFHPQCCSYTTRILKPLIWQDTETIPPRVKMHMELSETVQKLFPSNFNEECHYKRAPINYWYVRPEHIPAMQSLAETYFWPKIDLDIAISYIEFSCVATYKKIIIGFGFITPGEHLSEGYVSFLFVRPQWRHCGIASFILYHLTQTCQAWNISLNVSASNTSMTLYQKFGFKSHTFLRNFYESYISGFSNECKHSYLMILENDASFFS